MAKATMDLKSGNTGKVERYSPAEVRLFELLNKSGKPISSTDLMEKFFKGRKEKDIPVNGRTSMNVSLKRLMLKLDRNREPYQVVQVRTKGLAIQWLIQPRQKRQRTMTRKVTAAVAAT